MEQISETAQSRHQALQPSKTVELAVDTKRLPTKSLESSRTALGLSASATSPGLPRKKSGSRLRVAFYDPSGSGGICHYTFQLAQSLALAGVDVMVFTSDDYELQHLPRAFKTYALFKRSWIRGLIQWVRARVTGTVWSDGVNALRQVSAALPDASSGNLSFMQVLRLKIIHIKAVWLFLWSRPDLIHFQWLANRKEDIHLVKALKRLGFKIVYTAHDLLPQVNPSAGDREIYQRIYQLADQVIVHAESNKRELMSLFEIPLDKVSVLHHGSYDLFHSHNGLSKMEARKELGIAQGRKVILFFGLIKRYKGLEYLVEAFEKVRRTVNDATLLIVGNIYQGVAEESRFYTGLLGQLRAQPDVICVNEYVPCERIGVYFSASDVVVLPYTKSYQSGVLLSAYAAGRPVIVTDTGGLSEAVEQEKSGLVVPPREVDALARSIIRVLGNPAEMEEMGRYAKYLADTTYSWDAIASKTIDCYHSLLAKPKASQPTGFAIK